MKKALLMVMAVLVISNSHLFSQNIQLLYEFSKQREYFVTTLEMFKPDDYGSTFFFADLDYGRNNGGMSLAYFEIARYVTLPLLNDKLDVTLQFNDGIADFGALGQVWLCGLSYPVDLGFMEVKTDLLLRMSNFTARKASWQVTFAWYQSFLKDKLIFTGFADVWQEQLPGEKNRTVLLTEPQLWFKAWDHLKAGGELEISSNFLPGSKFELMPALGIRWDF